MESLNVSFGRSKRGGNTFMQLKRHMLPRPLKGHDPSKLDLGPRSRKSCCLLFCGMDWKGSYRFYF
jgi:hypothetical protein